MTGDDSYHAHCFKCKVCKNRIEELVFAKTSQGIYCMDCHNARVAKSRRHAQRQKEKQEAAARAAASEMPNSPSIGVSPATNGVSLRRLELAGVAETNSFADVLTVQLVQLPFWRDHERP
jgi:hypothetical protein